MGEILSAQKAIGDLLVSLGSLAPEQRDRALEIQKAIGGRLGDILIGEGYVPQLRLHRALANQRNLPFADLLREPPETELLVAADRQSYLKHGCLPWKKKDGLLHLAAVQPDVAKAWAESRYGSRIAMHQTSPRDIQRAVASAFAMEDDADARLGLWHNHPALSARTRIFSRYYRFAPVALLATVFVLLAMNPGWMGPCLWALTVFYGVHLAFKTMLFIAAHLPRRPAPPLAPVQDAELPVYTLLIPMYKEAESIPGLLAAIRALDYPRSRLDVKLIIEQDDDVTWDAIRAAKPEDFFEVIRVPPSQPRTKPKALNYALRFARGDYLTIYDAEDRPEPDQLRKAASAFRAAKGRLSCIQGRLNYYNREENLLTRWFSLEYAIWFRYFLPGLEQLGIPIPLGGTSNHMPTGKLRELMAWDPYNVTEDADLGLRIAGFGQRTDVLDSTTWEEAPIHTVSWLRQRSRWIKGYLQTWLVHMRRPGKLLRRTGLMGFLGIQLFVGAPCLIFLFGPAFWVLTLGWAFGLAAPATPLPPELKVAAITVLITSIIQHIVFAYLSSRIMGWKGMKLAILSFPFYWILHSIASFRAIWQLIVAPHYWDKTAHGVSRFLTTPASSA
ncbi:MAG: glycosyltransferase [Alphaproteobacteria bacterium]|nr:glycosyltransferase [Alphaproteobacteria bacterium]